MPTLAILTRPGRRTHMYWPGGPLCGTQTGMSGAVLSPVDIAGGATPRLVGELSRHMGDNSCIRCTRLLAVIVLMYGVRDTGKAMRTW